MKLRPPPPDILSPAHVADPWPGYAVLRDHYPIHWHEESQSWLVTRYEHLRPLVRDSRLGFRYAQEMMGQFLGDAPMLPAMDGKEHAAHRSLVSPFLHSAGLESFSETIERRAHALLDPILDREQRATEQGTQERAAMDFVTEFSSVYPVDIVADMMGLPGRDYARFQEWYNAFIQCLGNVAGDEQTYQNGLRAKQEFGDYFLPLIAARRGCDGDDLISRLTRAEVRGERLNDEDIRSFLALMLTAGGESTDHQLAALLHALIEHPDQLQALAEDRSLMDAVLAEGMRYCSIVQFIQHEAYEDIDLDGNRIAAGSRVTLMFAAGNHDPRRFENADEFDIHRTDNAPAKAFTGNADHLGFGGGRHVCLGAQLTKREQQIALDLLLDRVTDLRFADGYEPQWRGHLVRHVLSLRLDYMPL